MGVDLLVIRKNQSSSSGTFEDQSGLRLMTACSANLTELAETLGVKSLDDFIDSAGAEFQFYEEWHGEEAPDGWLEENRQWFAPGEAINTLRTFSDYFKKSGLDHIVPKVEYMAALDPLMIVSPYTPVILDPPPIEVADLLDDLEECLKMLQAIEREKDLFCFEVSV